ncbi:hypothetical protein GARC_0004 [Paraglaciecola arctica BSs20135]|uniref:Uncharacterized protein n=1 Tax=Paraglaciecola arctica BSs20135 TaxID=493475 RepID=K6XZA0_9ALTE|nr:hypothetical protein GARC_0004 [Paraglaciecola arctica BSs20135]
MRFKEAYIPINKDKNMYLLLMAKHIKLAQEIIYKQLTKQDL